MKANFSFLERIDVSNGFTFKKAKELVLKDIDWRNTLNGDKNGKSQFAKSLRGKFQNMSFFFQSDTIQVLELVKDLILFHTEKPCMRYLTAAICAEMVIKWIGSNVELAHDVCDHIGGDGNWVIAKGKAIREIFIEKVLNETLSLIHI